MTYPTSLINDDDIYNRTDDMYASWLQVAPTAYATQSLFLGSEVINTSGLLDDSLWCE